MRPPNRALRWRLWVVLAATSALVLRLAHLVILLDKDPLLIAPMMDAAGYHAWALRILATPLGDRVFFQDPGFPYALALIYRLLGPSWAAAAVVQSVVGALTVWVVAATARRLPLEHRDYVAVVAAWVLALYQPFIFYDALVLKPQLATFLGALCLWVFLRAYDADEPVPRYFWLASAGTAFGILVLFRGNFYLAGPPLLVWVALARWGPSTSRGMPGRAAVWSGLGRVAVVGLATASVLAVVAVRNYAVAGRWAVTSAHAGTVVYYGHNPYSPLGDFKRLPFVRADPQYEEHDFRAEARRRTGAQLNSQEASRYWLEQSVAYCASDPWLTVRRIFHKLALAVESYEHGDNYSYKFHAQFSPLLRPTIPWWTLVLALSAGLLLGPKRRWKPLAPVLIMLLGYLATLPLFFVSSRYRIAVVPFLALLAAAEAVWLWSWLRQRRYWPAVVHAALIVGIGATSLSLGLPRTRGENLGTWWAYLGSQHVQRGNVAHGLGLMRQATVQDPRNGLIWGNFGRTQLRLGRPDKAARLCRKALSLEGDPQGARDCLALALFQQGRPAEALTVLRPLIDRYMPAPRYLLAAAIYEALGDSRRAIDHLRGALAEHGDNAYVRRQLARIARRSRPE